MRIKFAKWFIFASYCWKKTFKQTSALQTPTSRVSLSDPVSSALEGITLTVPGVCHYSRWLSPR